MQPAGMDATGGKGCNWQEMINMMGTNPICTTVGSKFYLILAEKQYVCIACWLQIIYNNRFDAYTSVSSWLSSALDHARALLCMGKNSALCC